jgi:Mn-dependent DtxR family transcriptional regulator
MLYQRSQEIERRLETVLGLIRTGRYSTPTLAEEVGVSIPTVSRCVTALRERGHNIRAEKLADGWRYVLVRNTTKTKSRRAAEFVEVHG